MGESASARYIGRVGGLAFALGIGAAMITGTAVAGAETGAESGSTAASSASTTSSGTTTSSNATTSSGAESEPTRERDADADESSATDTDTDTDEPADTAADDDADAPDEDATPARTTRSWAATRAARREAASAPEIATAATAADVSPADRFFRNVTPTLSHDPSEDTVVGDTIVGDLHPVDPDSSRLRYTATRPAHGTVKVDADGTFVYTPNASYAGQDKFTVTVSDARSGLHFHTGGGLLSLFTFGLLGNSGHRTTQTVYIGRQRTVVASGLSQPVDFRFLPDGRVVVAEKGGAIKVVDDGVSQTLITLPVLTQGERGINGIAVDPDFATNGYLYVAYTTTGAHDRLSRLTMVGAAIDPATETVLLESGEAAAFYHRGGALAFGPDGKLYWGLGDNRESGNAQDLTNFHGKILRINRDGTTPSDNPVLGAGALPQIYAYGLRNPFRLTFTPTGHLLVADVGEASFEELNLVTAGGNYGWPGSEGLCTSNCAGTIDPIHTYAHGSGAAITSVLVYTGGQLGAGYQGKVFIADTVQGWIKVLSCTADFTACGSPQDFDPQGGATVGLAQGPDGNLYQLSYDPGELVRIAPAGPAPTASRAV